MKEVKTHITQKALKEICCQKVEEIGKQDGVKCIMADDSWLLIRPSGTESVLRVYVEGRTHAM